MKNQTKIVKQNVVRFVLQKRRVERENNVRRLLAVACLVSTLVAAALTDTTGRDRRRTRTEPVVGRELRPETPSFLP